MHQIQVGSRTMFDSKFGDFTFHRSTFACCRSVEEKWSGYDGGRVRVVDCPKQYIHIGVPGSAKKGYRPLAQFGT